MKFRLLLFILGYQLICLSARMYVHDKTKVENNRLPLHCTSHAQWSNRHLISDWPNLNSVIPNNMK